MEILENNTATTPESTSHFVTGNTFKTVAAVAGIAVGAAALLAPRPARAVTPALTFNDIPGSGDIKVLNYALALEALEADLYTQALLRLTTGGTNALGQTIPGLGLSDSEPDVKYTRQFGKVEAEHRDFLNGALGDQSIIGTGANGALRNAKFDFGFTSASRQQVVELLYVAESTGVQAYLGAIKYFATRTYLAAAGAIQGTEARHTAAIAIVFNSLGFTPIKDTAPLAGQTTTILGQSNTSGIDGTLEPDQVLAAVSPFIVLPATL